jgi:hypothetical protein
MCIIHFFVKLYYNPININGYRVVFDSSTWNNLSNYSLRYSRFFFLAQKSIDKVNLRYILFIRQV